MTQPAFELLSEPIRHCLWRMGWTELRPIQTKAIHLILETMQDLIISAATASGKTEAAFLPVISDLVERPAESITAIYVSPLKALINDQFRRLDELCEHAELPVHRWHGDVGQAAKAQVIKAPAGILLITPESLESLFINRSSAIPRIFRDLRYVVVDELHALVGSERGTHLRSLLHRVEKAIGHSYRVIALSATLGDWTAKYAAWIRPGNAQAVTLVTDDSDARTIRLKIYGYTIGKPSWGNGDESPGEATDEPECSHTLDEMLRAFGGHKNLIFANRKDQVERFADALNERCRSIGRPPEFLVHHGSLSKEIREDTEQMMRGDRPFTTLCSSTLELGIDIGNVKAVGQIGPPWSVSSVIQRLGRSGRREGEASELRMFIEEFALDADADLIDRLYPDLLQAIALTELMLDKWLEPPDTNVLDLSTLIQQTLSVLGETGGTSVAHVFQLLVSDGAFDYVSKSDFLEVLRCLGQQAIIEQMAEGDLILAIEGERVVRSREFYSAFASTKEYAVLHAGQPIGSLPAIDPPPPNDHLLLAGRRWRVVDVDVRREEIHVVPSKGRKSSRFHGSGGNTHDKVRQMMRDVLLGSKAINYLNTTASDWLSQARASAVSAGIFDGPWHQFSKEHCYLFTWSGTRVQRTILLLARAAGLDAIDRDIAVEFHASVDAARMKLVKFLENPIPLESLLALVPFKQQRKYDMYLSNELLDRCYTRNALEIDEAIRRLTRLMRNDS